MGFDKNLLLAKKSFRDKLDAIYNVPAEKSAERIVSLLKRHNDPDARLFSSPGRIEIVGNHTDHNNGKVLAAAVSVDTIAAVTPLSENKVIVDSVGYPLVEVDLSDLAVNPAEKGTSDALIRGVAKGFVDRGLKIGGFRATTTSNVSKGAGVSSSASFEVLASEIFNVLYNDKKVSKVDKAIISQYAENVYFGKPSGLMDQSAISLGGVSYIDFKDTKNPVIENLDWRFDDLAVVIVNCGGDHCNLTPEYSAIRSEMESVAGFFGEKTLRFVDEHKFGDGIAELMQKVSGRAILRAYHFFAENKRVEDARRALKKKDKEGLLKAVEASGRSSYMLLQNCYPEGDKAQRIPLALAVASAFPAIGAVRVHGGGFAGTILTFLEAEKATAFVVQMGKLFGKDNVFNLKIRKDGAVEIPLK